MKGKIIVIEGTDCSGKETQTNLLLEFLEKQNIKAVRYSFPNYDSPTGKIVGGPYLGKNYICDGWFKEGATSVDAKVASLYFAADRKYNIDNINKKLNEGYIVILDRYCYSNMAHQASKLADSKEREEIYNFIDTLEFGLLELPKSDIKILLYMPTKEGKILRTNRDEKLDEHEINDEYLERSSNAYLEIADRYNFDIINCTKDNKIKSIKDIHHEVINVVKKYI